MEKDFVTYSVQLTQKERKDLDVALSLSGHRTVSSLLRQLISDYLKENLKGATNE